MGKIARPRPEHRPFSVVSRVEAFEVLAGGDGTAAQRRGEEEHHAGGLSPEVAKMHVRVLVPYLRQRGFAAGGGDAAARSIAGAIMLGLGGFMVTLVGVPLWPILSVWAGSLAAILAALGGSLPHWLFG